MLDQAVAGALHAFIAWRHYLAQPTYGGEAQHEAERTAVEAMNALADALADHDKNVLDRHGVGAMPNA